MRNRAIPSVAGVLVVLSGCPSAFQPTNDQPPSSDGGPTSTPVVNLVAPTGLYAVTVTADKIVLGWTDTSSGETGFQMQRKTDEDGAYEDLGIAAANSTSYADTGLPSGRIYYYRVRAVRQTDVSDWSQEILAATNIPFTLNGQWYTTQAGDTFAPESTPSVAPKLGTDMVRPLPKIGWKESRAIIVKYRPGVARSRALEAEVRAYGTERPLRSTAAGSLSRIQVDLSRGRTLQQAIDYYASLPYVEYAEPDQMMYALAVPDDPAYQYQWHLEELGMPQVWDVVTGIDSVVVAVIDTGASPDLSDYADTSFVQGYDFVNGDTDPHDDNAHGTHVSGTIAESTNNGGGAAGMAYGVSIMPLKVLGADGSGLTSDIVDAIYYAADNGADVINMSLGGGGYSTTMHDAVKYAYEHGVAIFCASGNESSQVGYPAAYDDYVMAVGATRFDDQVAYYSNYGPSLDIVAPGGDTRGDLNHDDYPDGVLQQTITGYNEQTGTTDYTPGHFFFQGTSMASPHVAALGALLKSADPTLTPAEIYSIIVETAVDLGDSGRDDDYGYGRIDPVAAIASLGVDVPGPQPVPDPDPDPDPGPEPQPGSTAISDSIVGALNPLTNRVESFTIHAAPGLVDLELLFSHANGDLDLYLYDPDGWDLDFSISVTDNEAIEYTATEEGAYTIKVRLWQGYGALGSASKAPAW